MLRHMSQPRLYACLALLFKPFPIIKVSTGSGQQHGRNSLVGPGRPQDVMLRHMSQPKLYACLAIIFKPFPMDKVSIGSGQQPGRNSLVGPCQHMSQHKWALLGALCSGWKVLKSVGARWSEMKSSYTG